MLLLNIFFNKRMGSIFLLFEIRLNDYSERFRFYGPSFHRWLPNGVHDALDLDTHIPDTLLKIWFVRRGRRDNYTGGMIEFDHTRNEVDETIMKKQGRLDAGNLYGKLQIDNVTNELLEALQQKKENDSTYIELGNTFQKAVYSPISRFLCLLRVRYGQYWIAELRKWNSQNESICEYCNQFSISWSSDGQTWNPFTPDCSPMLRTAIVGRQQDFKLFLTEVDWQNMPKILKDYNGESAASESSARANEYLEQGELRHAIIDSVTAIELMIPDFLKIRCKESRLQKALNPFFDNASIVQQWAIVGTLLGLPDDKIKNGLDVIEMRNKIVHKNKTPSKPFESKLKTFLGTLSNLLGEPELRFPTHHVGNMLRAEEQWNGQNSVEE